MATSQQVLNALAAMQKGADARFDKIEAALVQLLAVAPVDKPLLSCDFESGFGDFYEQAKALPRAMLAYPGRLGRKAVLLHTEPGDDNVNGSGTHERNDLALSQQLTDGYEGAEQWFAHSILFPDDFEIPPVSTTETWNWATVFDFHNTSDDGVGQANFSVLVYPTTAISADRPTGIHFKGYGGGPTDPVEYGAPVAPVIKNVWYDFVYHIKWSSGPDGFFDAWVNGKQKLSRRVPTLYAGQGVYLKLANYHTPTGKPSSVLHDRIRRGHTWQSVSLTQLEGIT